MQRRSIPMIAIHPEFLKKNNKEEFAILDYNEYRSIVQYIEDLEDLLDLRKAKLETKDEPTSSLDEVKQSLGIE
jgi:hypothetical protein